MTDCHNPYHFTPVKPGVRPDDMRTDEFPQASGHVAHDRYYPDTYSGRIVCRLTTETPLVVGASREKASKERPAQVAPFELEGRPAIPASTLRGLISSIAEAASNSALRVLEDQPYSYRRTMDRDTAEKDKPLSAIGMIFIDRDQGGEPQLDRNKNPRCRLRPLTLPTIEVKPAQPITPPGGYQQATFPQPNLKVYIGNTESIRRNDYHYDTYNESEPVYYGLRLHQREWSKQAIPEDEYLSIKRGRYLLAQKPIVTEDPRPWEELSESERNEYTRGILRVLGCVGRGDIPITKKHEIFIPYTEETERWKTFEVEPEAVERFYDLADARSEASDDDTADPWPYHPKGTTRNPNPNNVNDKTFRLKDGDLVYFRGDGLGRVQEISLSSIWRGRVETLSNKRASAHTFFESVSPELLPFNSARKIITIAEQVFGFVAQDKSEEQDSALALAGRVYFSHAHLRGIRTPNSTELESVEEGLKSVYLPSATLKILDGPKPPSPALYFTVVKGKPKYIAKSRLNPREHQPQGRKFYLHHRREDIAAEHWRSKHQYGETQTDLDQCRFKQKAQVTPLKPGVVFYFHLDFDNLSEREMGLLLYALQPAPDFRHKLGMGKPLGLGGVKIEPVGVFCINRAQRYTDEGIFAPRYSEIWTASAEEASVWPDEYSTEKAAQGRFLDSNQLREKFRVGMDTDIKRALTLLGAPGAVHAPVHTPLMEGGDDEDETFAWFVANDKSDPSERQSLEPLTESSKKLPLLIAKP